MNINGNTMAIIYKGKLILNFSRKYIICSSGQRSCQACEGMDITKFLSCLVSCDELLVVSLDLSLIQILGNFILAVDRCCAESPNLGDKCPYRYQQLQGYIFGSYTKKHMFVLYKFKVPY
ncbi:hypothetical protein SUGI_1087440 [Cryptomeria japonica]|nr:hypothetical protein SUGI_1087440 [Cryptomeria japonica]